jgi:hypothetical protein
MTDNIEADFSTGDPVGWHATIRHGAGSGIVLSVRREEGRVDYHVQKLIDGKAVGDVFRVEEDVMFPIRSLRDPRPQPGTHRGSDGR